MGCSLQTGQAAKGNPPDAKFYAAKTPGYVQISRQEHVLDILRNTTNSPGHVKEFSIKPAAAATQKPFGGNEELLSWDNILGINRSVSVP
jgi:hypothetical protein